MSRGIFASIDSGAGFPANGLTVILISRSELPFSFRETVPSCAKEKRTLFGCASGGGQRSLLPGIDCLVPDQEGRYERPVFRTGDSCRRSIRGRTIVCQGDWVCTACEIVECGPVGVSQGIRHVPVVGVVLRWFGGNGVVGQNPLTFLFVVDRLLVLADVLSK